MRVSSNVVSTAVACATWLLFAHGCGGSNSGSGFGDDGNNGGDNGGDNGGGSDSGSFGDALHFGDGGSGGDGSQTQCVNLQCQQATCSGGTSTTISGTVFDPAGKDPLYNIVVYVPNSTPDPLPSGVGASACDCGALFTGNPITATITDANGHFVLSNVPDGTNIPLVLQVGKWRQELTIPTVSKCVDNPQADGTLKLPSKSNPPTANIPDIAISTGSADTLECLLSRIGVDSSEYVPGTSTAGHLHIFSGGGDFSGAPNTSPPGPSSDVALWSSMGNLMLYDIVLLSCEGSETYMPNQQAMHDYASAGGRVFASHFHYAWFNTGPYASENLATWHTGTQDLGNINGTIETTLPNGTAFPKGVALNQWLGTVNALTGGLLPIQEARHNSDVSASNTPSTPWIVQSGGVAATEYFSFNTPTTGAMLDDAGDPEYCGRVVFSDLHVGAASGDTGGTIPGECAHADLSPQEKALEFMLFDLSSCVTIGNQPPVPPTTPPPPQ
jgi:hypothetical protein